MKKLIALFLVLCFSLALVACGAPKDEVPAIDVTGEEDVPTASLANPFVYYDSLEELNSAVCGALSGPAVMGKTEETFSSILVSDYTIGEYQFYLNGSKCVLRFAAPYDVDISGIYSAGVEAMGKDVVTEKAVLFEDVDCWSIKWFTIDGQYVFTIFDDSISEDSFMSIYEELHTYSMENMFAQNGEG